MERKHIPIADRLWARIQTQRSRIHYCGLWLTAVLLTLAAAWQDAWFFSIGPQARTLLSNPWLIGTLYCVLACAVWTIALFRGKVARFRAGTMLWVLVMIASALRNQLMAPSRNIAYLVVGAAGIALFLEICIVFGAIRNYRQFPITRAVLATMMVVCYLGAIGCLVLSLSRLAILLDRPTPWNVILVSCASVLIVVPGLGLPAAAQRRKGGYLLHGATAFCIALGFPAIAFEYLLWPRIVLAESPSFWGPGFDCVLLGEQSGVSWDNKWFHLGVAPGTFGSGPTERVTGVATDAAGRRWRIYRHASGLMATRMDYPQDLVFRLPPEVLSDAGTSPVSSTHVFGGGEADRFCYVNGPHVVVVRVPEAEPVGTFRADDQVDYVQLGDDPSEIHLVTSATPGNTDYVRVRFDGTFAQVLEKRNLISRNIDPEALRRIREREGETLSHLGRDLRLEGYYWISRVAVSRDGSRIAYTSSIDDHTVFLVGGRDAQVANLAVRGEVRLLLWIEPQRLLIVSDEITVGDVAINPPSFHEALRQELVGQVFGDTPETILLVRDRPDRRLEVYRYRGRFELHSVIDTEFAGALNFGGACGRAMDRLVFELGGFGTAVFRVW